jgi:poly-gamma-glutamate synthase PgsB/CapB
MGQFYELSLLLLLFIFLAWGIREWHAHLRNLKSIPNRIIVNGTRGKSSVTRLIAAGLKAGGFKVFAKTTGTKPRMIINNEIETPVIRLGRANIHEQIGMIRQAVRGKNDTVVFENMSLRPDLQIIEEGRIVQPNVVVITNVRADHLDVMGPTLTDIVRSFVNAAPKNSRIVTGEKELIDEIKTRAAQKAIPVEQSHEEDIEEKEMANFPYLEHRENVALALAVCRLMGVDDKTARRGIFDSRPDPGALRKYELKISGKQTLLYNALAANDPDSTYLIYERLGKPRKNLYLLVNCRDDRIDRSLQMADLIEKKIPADGYFICGRNTLPLIRHARSRGVAKDKLIDLEGASYERIFQVIGEHIRERSTIIAIGNIVGYGEDLIAHIIDQGRQ